jgi:hypothetical protein
VQTGRHLRIPLVRHRLSVYPSRCSGCSRHPDPRPYQWGLHYRRSLRLHR